MKNLINHLNEKPDPEIQILPTILLILDYNPTNM